MAKIPQKSLFNNKDLNNLGDLERLQRVLDNLPDEGLMQLLENKRSKGRNDYPVRYLWNAVIAGIVFQHESIASLRRELLRNSDLREMCGFDPLNPVGVSVPRSYNFSRFLKNLMDCYDQIEEIFHALVHQIEDLLPGFGKTLAHDGKAIQTFARMKKRGYQSRDGRRDIDANIGIKTYSKKTKDGNVWQIFKKWFGYRLHLIVDADTELPVAFNLTKASEAETPIAHKMLDQLQQRHPGILEKTQCFTSDRGNDDVKLIIKLWDDYAIKPVIGIRNMWKDSDKTKGISTGQNAVYNYKGTVFCVCPKTGDQKRMPYGGFEKDRSCHKYRCPAYHNGLECGGKNDCEIFRKRYLRIKLKEDRRIFVPLARCSYRFDTVYKKRTSVERVNSRVDYVYGFEKHFIRGQKKMKTRICLAFIVMLAIALSRIKDDEKEKCASLIS